jgi:methyl-accepting chemotaxis protein
LPEISALQSDAADCFQAVQRIGEVIQILRPLFGSVASAVGQQNNATNAVARNAAGTLRFAEAVSAGAADIHDAAAGANARGKSVEQHGRNVFDLAEKLKLRVTIFLRQSEAGDRRRHDRLPCEIDVELGTDSRVVRGCTADLSEGGALTRVVWRRRATCAPYLIQVYARDMGNGATVVMREIDGPIRVFGKHWGGFRSAYDL